MMITGGVHSGACCLVIPDGRPCWTHAFLKDGYRVVLADWPGVGRSGYVRPSDLGGDLIVRGLGKVLETIGEPKLKSIDVISAFMKPSTSHVFIQHNAGRCRRRQVVGIIEDA